MNDGFANLYSASNSEYTGQSGNTDTNFNSELEQSAPDNPASNHITADCTNTVVPVDNSPDNLQNMEAIGDNFTDTQPDNLPPPESVPTDYTGLISNINSLVYQHNYDFNKLITVSGNAVTVTPDDNTTALISVIADNQKNLIDGQNALYGMTTLLFLTVMLDIMAHFAKRIIKNMMRSKNNV